MVRAGVGIGLKGMKAVTSICWNYSKGKTGCYSLLSFKFGKNELLTCHNWIFLVRISNILHQKCKWLTWYSSLWISDVEGLFCLFCRAKFCRAKDWTQSLVHAKYMLFQLWAISLALSSHLNELVSLYMKFLISWILCFYFVKPKQKVLLDFFAITIKTIEWKRFLRYLFPTGISETGI